MSSTPDPQEMQRRLESLEARVEALARRVETERVVVLGRGGKPVIEMAASPEGEPEIVLSDMTGRERVLLRLVDDEGALELLDGAGGTRLRVAASERTTRVVLWPVPEGPRRIELRVAADGSAMLVVPDADGPRASVGVDGAGHCVLSIAPPRAAQDAAEGAP